MECVPRSGPRQGGLTKGRLTCRDEGRPVPRSPPRRTGGPGYDVSFHQLPTCRHLGLGQRWWSRAEQKTQKFVLHSALRPNQISFSHSLGQEPPNALQN
jgi:hypothetical protein